MPGTQRCTDDDDDDAKRRAKRARRDAKQTQAGELRGETDYSSRMAGMKAALGQTAGTGFDFAVEDAII